MTVDGVEPDAESDADSGADPGADSGADPGANPNSRHAGSGFGPVLVLGVGLIGTSVALALRRSAAEVWLFDTDPSHLALASSLGAGAAYDRSAEPALVIVATPPDLVATVVADGLDRWPGAVVTDVGSIKTAPLRALSEALGTGKSSAIGRYVGSHPMAGSERSGPTAASADLFDGRTWAITPHEHALPAAVEVVVELARRCGAEPTLLSPEAHDRAVARISHLPHLMAALTAGLLADAPADELALSGQGVRDTTRIAAGDPALWRQIVSANAPAISDLLADVRAALEGLQSGLAGDDVSRRATAERVLQRGVDGVSRLPGKHGAPTADLAAVTVVVPDRPGSLAQLFAELDDLGANVEDLRIDHDPARRAGVVEIDVAEGLVRELVAALVDHGWAAHG